MADEKEILIDEVKDKDKTEEIITDRKVELPSDEEMKEFIKKELEKAGIDQEEEKSIDPKDEEINRLNLLLKESQDRLLRYVAEFDNYKKRTERDFGNIIKNANENLILSLIPILDNFERALNHNIDESNLESFKQGIEMIYSQLYQILMKEGVNKIDALDNHFDPNLHDAMLVMEKEGIESGIVIQEIEKGYKLNEKVIRHSKVVVSK